MGQAMCDMKDLSPEDKEMSPSKQRKSPFRQKIARVWVCGPPAMNEELDQALTKLAPYFGLDPKLHIDIM
jgi:predicted ferric reductase